MSPLASAGADACKPQELHDECSSAMASSRSIEATYGIDCQPVFHSPGHFDHVTRRHREHAMYDMKNLMDLAGTLVRFGPDLEYR